MIRPFQKTAFIIINPAREQAQCVTVQERGDTAKHLHVVVFSLKHQVTHKCEGRDKAYCHGHSAIPKAQDKCCNDYSTANTHVAPTQNGVFFRQFLR